MNTNHGKKVWIEGFSAISTLFGMMGIGVMLSEGGWHLSWFLGSLCLILIGALAYEKSKP